MKLLIEKNRRIDSHAKLLDEVKEYSEVKELKDENHSLKELVAELLLDNRDLKKNLNGED